MCYDLNKTPLFLGPPQKKTSPWRVLFFSRDLWTEPGGARGATVGASDAVRQRLEAQAHDVMRQMEPDDERYNEIPPEYGRAAPR